MTTTVRSHIATASLFVLGALLLGAASARAQPLVSTDWLSERLGEPGVRVLDVRSRIDGTTPESFAAGHIPGAVHSDYTTAGWRAKRDGVPAMLPPMADLERLVGGLGIGNDSHVVIVTAGKSALDYGSATRVYWTFKVMGHDAVSILDGGHTLWVKEGRPLETGVSTPTVATFTSNFRPELVADRRDIEAVVNGDSSANLIDNRPLDQFTGKTRAKVAGRSGHIPGAMNVPQGQFRSAETGRFASTSALGTLYDAAGAGASTSGDIAYCNTGHWASLGWFTSSELLGRETKLYDGSMVEWSNDKTLPMVTGQ